MQQAQQHAVEALVAQREGHFVDGVDVAGRDDGLLGDIAEEADLLLEVAGQGTVGAAQQHVGLDADRTEVADTVLRGLGLELAGGADVGHQGEVHVDRVLAADVLSELPDGLEERQAFDVAHGAADFHQHHVDIASGGADAVLDFVGDVRDHLDGAAEVVAPPFLGEHRHVDLAGGPVAVARRRHAREALVVAEVEIGLRPIVGDVDLAVLVRAHGPGVDVDVGVELLEGDAVAMPFEDGADGRGGKPLAERRHHAAGDEDVFGGMGCLHGSTLALV